MGLANTVQTILMSGLTHGLVDFFAIKSTTCGYLDVTVRIGAVDNFHTTSRFFLPDSLDRGIPVLTAKRVRHAVHRQNDQEPQQRPRVGGRTWMIVTLDTRKA